jgi:ATP-dependent DNA helicase RecG
MKTRKGHTEMGELQKIKGVGAAMEAKLNAGGIHTIAELVGWFPTRYETHKIQSFAQASLKTEVVLCAVVTKKANVAYLRKRLTRMSLEVLMGEHPCKVAIFNREFLRLSLVEGAEIVLTGRFETNFNQLLASDIQLQKNYQEGIIPIYHFPKVGDGVFAKLVRAALSFIRGELKDDIPLFLRQKNQLTDLPGFYKAVHHPETEADILSVSRWIKYDELLRFALRIVCLKRENDAIWTQAKKYDIEAVRKFIATLPFTLTEDQKAVTNEIFRDLKKTKQMNRLLQGDVGSGKTVVAAIAAMAVITGKEQVALMAPTEILAYQDYQTFKNMLSPFGIRIGFLSSAIKGKDRSDVLDDLFYGRIDMIAGTHALIQEAIQFRHLGFVIIDEQHRFGVKQRKALREKGFIPAMLFLSATPIPRTLAISIFGDMEVSSIRTLPSGRKTTQTFIRDFSAYDEVVNHVIRELDQGHQAYFIVPLIEENEKGDFLDVSAVLSDLRKKIPARYKVAGLHGKMAVDEKQTVLNRFSQGDIAVLVSTTVVEVGVNVPNATEMVILNCERFGLSQLHQLRGRVGRSEVQAYCHLITDTILLGNKRFEILEKTTDGFEIAEEDLRQRGPGEVFGEEQTGIPKFRMANLITDQALFNTALEDAKLLLQSQDEAAKKLVQSTILGIEETNLD